MKILGLDPATKTGWAVVDDAVLVDYGAIEISSKLPLGARLIYLSKEIKKLLNSVKPDYIAVEDVVMAVSGVKVLAYLARLSGCIVKECHEYMDVDPTFYEPSTWKKHSIEGLVGNSKKYQILFAVAIHYNLLTETQIETINESIEFEIEKQNDLKYEIKILRSKKQKKKNDEIEIHEFNKKIHSKKKQLKKLEKTCNKSFSEISNDITAITNISEDMADAICIAIAKQLEQKNGNTNHKKR
jgi:Holliday junction resolvasome RuvABC endonuclease subunit